MADVVRFNSRLRSRCVRLFLGFRYAGDGAAAFPGALELITGRFLRHSPEFYAWRIKDREARLLLQPSDSRLYDDLAVAYDKIGQGAKGIEYMLKLEEIQPGRYETFANLGTLYIHAGDLEKGVELIDKAIAINPNAHFGREVYQRHLVEFVMLRRRSGVVGLPLSPIRSGVRCGSGVPYNFREFILEKKGVSTCQIQAEATRPWRQTAQKRLHETRLAVKGVLGMMRFGNHESPILLEALGDLLAGSMDEADAKWLGTRAYLRASYLAGDEVAAQKYRELAQNALSRQWNAKLDDVEKMLARELKQASGWYAKIREDELRWIANGQNPEKLFAARYYATAKPSPAKTRASK